MARLDEQDFDEKRLSRRQRRKQGELIAYIILSVFILLLAGGIFLGVHFISGLFKEKVTVNEEVEMASSEDTSAAVIATPTEVSEPQEYTEEDLSKEIVDSILSEMTIEDKVAGLFIVTPEQLTGVDTAVKAGSGTQEALSNYAVGGVVYAAKNIKSTDQIKEMLDTSVSMSKYPLFTILSETASHADSVVTTLSLAPEEEISDSKTAHSAGVHVGTQLFKYGFNFEVGPSIEISENGQFGQDVDSVKENVSEYATGLKESGVTACGSVFPMKADTASEAASIDVSKDDLVINQYEAFREAIESGSLGAVMVSNAAFPQVTGDDTPASLSGTMIEEELRGTLGYDGIVITSPLTDGAITGRYSPAEAAVNAVKAGADMIYIPENFTESYEALLSAVQQGSISEDRINESIRRIYRVKYADRVNQISQGS